MSDQLTIRITVDDGRGSQDNLEVTGIEDSVYGDRDRISYATNLNAGAKEKLKTISYKVDVSMTDLVNCAVKMLIRQFEEQRGEEYAVPDVFRVDDA